jgi:hypothetical protein
MDPRLTCLLDVDLHSECGSGSSCFTIGPENLNLLIMNQQKAIMFIVAKK